jgi:hypothetical protein
MTQLSRVEAFARAFPWPMPRAAGTFGLSGIAATVGHWVASPQSSPGVPAAFMWAKQNVAF